MLWRSPDHCSALHPCHHVKDVLLTCRSCVIAQGVGVTSYHRRCGGLGAAPAPELDAGPIRASEDTPVQGGRHGQFDEPHSAARNHSKRTMTSSSLEGLTFGRLRAALLHFLTLEEDPGMLSNGYGDGLAFGTIGALQVIHQTFQGWAEGYASPPPTSSRGSPYNFTSRTFPGVHIHDRIQWLELLSGVLWVPRHPLSHASVQRCHGRGEELGKPRASEALLPGVMPRQRPPSSRYHVLRSGRRALRSRAEGRSVSAI